MDLYSEIILDYYKNPKNKGQMADATIYHSEVNASCGDQVTIFLKFNEQDILEKITFDGVGCAISQAAASMLTEELVGKSKDEVKEFSNEKMYEILGVPISPGRVKCALLGLVTAKKATILTSKNE
jgi:nitrogen fixation NifU-like protein